MRKPGGQGEVADLGGGARQQARQVAAIPTADDDGRRRHQQEHHEGHARATHPGPLCHATKIQSRGGGSAGTLGAQEVA
jgi:hypothetical protein